MEYKIIFHSAAGWTSVRWNVGFQEAKQYVRSQMASVRYSRAEILDETGRTVWLHSIEKDKLVTGG